MNFISKTKINNIIIIYLGRVGYGLQKAQQYSNMKLFIYVNNSVYLQRISRYVTYIKLTNINIHIKICNIYKTSNKW